MLNALHSLIELRRVKQISKEMPTPLGADDDGCLASLIDRHVRERPDDVMIATESGETTWAEFSALSSQVANALVTHGLQQGDSIAVNMENCVEFLAWIIGAARVGVVPGLINTNLRGKQLLHCIQEVEARLIVVDANGFDALAEHADLLLATFPQRAEIWAHDVNDGRIRDLPDVHTASRKINAASKITPDIEPPIKAGAKAMYLFTSGTTGLPKAAIVTHRKFIDGAIASAMHFFRARVGDRLYVCLPLYHGTGLMVGVAACLYSGASLFLRRRFSASRFVDEINRYQCNLFVYIGDICRYVMAIPEQGDDARCALRTAVGNGLRPDIFKAFRRRFGVDRICEFYSASESNGGFVNFFNKDETIGLSPNTLRLVKYTHDSAQPTRNATGRLEVSAAAPFSGYRNAEASEHKLVRDAFADGDTWFNSGDLVKEVDVGFCFGIKHYQFVDRLGDTFRWKAENVSTTEVAELLCGFPQVKIAAVYGVEVPGNDGRAGMAAIALQDGVGTVDINAISRHVNQHLTSYARPRFLRVRDELEVTGTHKVVKGTLRKEAYDISLVRDPLYVLDVSDGLYKPLDKNRYDAIRSAEVRL